MNPSDPSQSNYYRTVSEAVNRNERERGQHTYKPCWTLNWKQDSPDASGRCT